jgi:hypothetical protein
MTYSTAHASVNVRGRKLVIETNNDLTKVSMLEGESTIKSGPNDMGGHIVHTGEQAIIRKGAPGQPNEIQISPIPESENDSLDEKVSMACQAKKTVYFDVRDRSTNGTGVNSFDGADGATQEIVPVETIPINLPTQYTVSPARISGGE